MHALEDRWRRHYSKTLLGRLRLGMFKEITGAEDTSPDPGEVRLFLMSQRRQRVFVGNMYDALFHLHDVKRTEWQELERPNDFRWILQKLERQPYREAVFVEVNGCPAPWHDTVGVLVRCDRMTIGGYVYSLLFIDDEFRMRKAVLGYAEVRARKEDRDVFVSVSSPDGYVDHSATSEDPHADLSTRILSFLAKDRKFRSVAEAVLSGAKFGKAFDGMEDPRLLELSVGVWRGEVSCSELVVPLDRVKPHDPGFALTYPSDLAKPILAEIRAGNRPAMVVYWRGDRFVMSDDYPVYIAYRTCDDVNVPVIVLGDYPAEFGKARRVGGPELFPDLMIMPDPRDLDEDTMDLVLESRLHGESSRTGPIELYVIHARLCELLEDKKITERRIHDFLHNVPLALDAYGASIQSEVTLGKRYRVDLVLQYATVDRRTLLVELEAPSKHLFTQSGRLRAPITHALQQVEDWLRWWAEYPSEIPTSLDGRVPPRGLVVAGRSGALTEDERMRLVHLNQNRRVTLITYDDLLDRLEEMIRHIEST